LTEDKTFVLIASHMGPYLSLLPLESELGSHNVQFLVSDVALADRQLKGLKYLDLSVVQKRYGGLTRYLSEENVNAILRSSPDLSVRNDVESKIGLAAQELNIPVFVIEDYPGNYFKATSERLDSLYVEGEYSLELHVGRGIPRERIKIFGNPRYDQLYNFDTETVRRLSRRKLGLDDAPVLLWAGQPDGENSYTTLTRLLSNFSIRDYTLLFRAHPRDTTYKQGRYQKLNTYGLHKVIDVTDFSDPIKLYCTADLVATQYSSAGVEASHLGIPAVYLLFDDLGKSELLRSKGYDLLPWCREEGAYLIADEEQVDEVMRTALFDGESRTRTKNIFRHKFMGHNASQAISTDVVQCLT